LPRAITPSRASELSECVPGIDWEASRELANVNRRDAVFPAARLVNASSGEVQYDTTKMTKVGYMPLLDKVKSALQANTTSRRRTNRDRMYDVM